MITVSSKRGWPDFAWPWLLGAALRLYQLPTQILVDDEWHMVHTLRNGAGLASLVTDFGSNDHSIGLSVCAWLLMQLVSLDELLLRLPSLLAGLLIITLIPAQLARLVGRATAIVLAWCLAVSPLLCFFSRLARPYAITTLLTGLAVIAFHRWFLHGGERRRAAGCYAASAALAPLFHLPSLPAVLAPLSLLILTRVFPPPSRPPSVRQTVRLMLGTISAMVLALALPALRSGAGVVARLHTDRLRLETIPGLLELLAGTGFPAGVALVGLLGGIGLVALTQRDRLLAGYLGAVIAVQLAAVVAGGATALHVPIVAARYLVVVLPLLWVFPAAGLMAAAQGLGVRNAHVVGATAAAVLLSIGPLGWIYRAPNDFTNHISYQADYISDRYFERFRPRIISAFYTQVLGPRPPATTTIVEAPWYFYFHDLAYTQRLHRQQVLIGFVDDGPDPVRNGELAPEERGIRLRRALHLGDRVALKERHVDFVVLHRDPLQELRWPTGVVDVAIDMQRWEERYRMWFGPPVFEDAQLVVFKTS